MPQFVETETEYEFLGKKEKKLPVEVGTRAQGGNQKNVNKT